MLQIAPHVKARQAPNQAFKRTQIGMASPWPSGPLNSVR